MSDSLCEIKINKDMRANDFLTRGEQANRAYTSPQVDVFNLQSEVLLCLSYGEVGAPGKDLDEENVWDL